MSTHHCLGNESSYYTDCATVKTRSCRRPGRNSSSVTIWGRTSLGDTAGNAARCPVARSEAAALGKAEPKVAIDRSRATTTAVTVTFKRVCHVDPGMMGIVAITMKRVVHLHCLVVGDSAGVNTCPTCCHVAVTKFRLWKMGITGDETAAAEGRSLIKTERKACRALHFTRGKAPGQPADCLVNHSSATSAS